MLGNCPGISLIEEGWLPQGQQSTCFSLLGLSFSSLRNALEGIKETGGVGGVRNGFGTVLLLEWQWDFRVLCSVQSVDPDFSGSWLCPRSPAVLRLLHPLRFEPHKIYSGISDIFSNISRVSWWWWLQMVMVVVVMSSGLWGRAGGGAVWWLW